jgi:hypothetical protein
MPINCLNALQVKIVNLEFQKEIFLNSKAQVGDVYESRHDKLFQWLTMLSTQLESAVELSSSLQVQHAAAQNTICARTQRDCAGICRFVPIAIPITCRIHISHPARVPTCASHPHQHNPSMAIGVPSAKNGDPSNSRLEREGRVRVEQGEVGF